MLNACKISVIVSLYNMEKDIVTCIESLINQTIIDKIEIVIINDGSTDNSGFIADNYAEKYENIFVIHQQNGGLSNARNTGINVCHGEYVSFVDSDDYIEHNMIEELYVNAMNNDADVAICHFYRHTKGFETKDNISTFRAFEKAGVFDRKQTLEMFLCRRLTGHACNKLFKKKIFIENDIYFPIGRLFEDIPTIGRYFTFINKIVCVDKPLYYYVYRKGSITASKSLKSLEHIQIGALEIYEDIKKRMPDMIDIAAFYISTTAIDCQVVLARVKRNVEGRSLVQRNINKLWAFSKTLNYLKHASRYYKMCWGLNNVRLLSTVVILMDVIKKILGKGETH